LPRVNPPDFSDFCAPGNGLRVFTYGQKQVFTIAARLERRTIMSGTAPASERVAVRHAKPMNSTALQQMPHWP
jgi:hypothetical protein